MSVIGLGKPIQEIQQAFGRDLPSCFLKFLDYGIDLGMRLKPQFVQPMQVLQTLFIVAGQSESHG